MHIGIGFFLSLIIGDRGWIPNPVRLLDKPHLQKNRPPGALHVAAIIGIAYLAVWMIILITAQVSLVLSIAVSSYFVYTELSIHSPGKKAKLVYEALHEGNRVLAGKRLSDILRHDTQDMNEEEIVSATVETMAKNTVNGMIAPLFYIFIGGPALGMAYKVLNTLANRNDFGSTAARFDDLANWIPARLTGLIMPMAGSMCGKEGRRGYKIFNRDKKKSKNLNNGYPVAAMAGVLGIQIANLGDPLKNAESQDILEAARVMRMTAFLGLAAFYIVALKFGNI